MVSELSEQDVFRKRDEIVSREIAGETILVPIKGKLADMQRIFSLNPVAGHIWSILDGTQNLGMILDSVLERFAVDRSQAEKDLRELVAELLAAGLIEAVD